MTLVKACLNGGRSRAEHDAVPLSPAELAADARRAVAAGARALHVHPRRPDGTETLEPAECAAAVAAIRRSCPTVPLGLSTGAWIDPGRRLELVAAWTALPDFVSVNLAEDGTDELVGVLGRRGIPAEAGLASVADVERLARSPLALTAVRVLVEIDGEEDPGRAVAAAAAIDDALDEASIELPRLHHGGGIATWAVLDAALARGRDVRVGLEDTLVLPDGSRARDNAQLVAAAVALASARGAGSPRSGSR